MKMNKNTRSPKARPDPARSRTLAVDIGGSGIKAVVLDANGKIVKHRIRKPTPSKATPRRLIAVVRELAREQGEFDRASVGFPGVIKDGVVYSAVNLGKSWKGFDLAASLQKKLGCPVRIANDADVQGMGCVTGHGIELVITLGTGFGSALFFDGHPIHLELGHHPFHKGKTYEEELGQRALDRKGRRKWNKLLEEAIGDLHRTFNYDRIYIGGGNGKYISIKLPPHAKIIPNEAGLIGGFALWSNKSMSEEHPAEGARQGLAAAPSRRAARRVDSAPAPGTSGDTDSSASANSEGAAT
jgi:polyphosphate glucokinase